MDDTTLMSVNDPRIPPEFQKMVVNLAGLKEPPIEVDLSDLQELYRRNETPTRYQLNTSGIKRLQSLIQGQHGEKSTTLGYNSFFAHVLRAKEARDTLTVGETILIERRKLNAAEYDQRHRKRTPSVTEIQNQLPPKIMNTVALHRAIKSLVDTYPYRHVYVDEKRGYATVSGVNNDTIAVGHMYGVALVTSYRILDARFDGSFFMGEVDASFRISVEYYAAQGGRAWFLLVDASRIMRTDDNIYGIPFTLYRMIRGHEKILASVPASITTDLQMSQWEAFVKDRPHGYSIWQWLSGPLANRIEKQINQRPQ